MFATQTRFVITIITVIINALTFLLKKKRKEMIKNDFYCCCY